MKWIDYSVENLSVKVLNNIGNTYFDNNNAKITIKLITLSGFPYELNRPINRKAELLHKKGVWELYVISIA